MMHFVKKGIAARKLGKPPGTIANYSVEGGRKTVAQVFEYGADFCNESVCEQIDELKPFAKSSERQWITITGRQKKFMICIFQKSASELTK